MKIGIGVRDMKSPTIAHGQFSNTYTGIKVLSKLYIFAESYIRIKLALILIHLY